MRVCDFCRNMYTDSTTGRSTMIRPTQTVILSLKPGFGGNSSSAIDKEIDVCGECQVELARALHNAVSDLTQVKNKGE